MAYVCFQELWVVLLLYSSNVAESMRGESTANYPLSFIVMALLRETPS